MTPEAFLGALRDAVEAERDDAALAARLALLPGGHAGVLAFLAEGMPRSFRPDLAAGAAGTVACAIETDGGEAGLCFVLDGERCRIERDAADADASVRLPLATFVRITFKQLTGGDAYVDGLVEASGDVVLATSLDGWFDAPAPEPARAAA